MKTPDMTKLLPPGTSWENEKTGIQWGIGLGALWSLSIPICYFGELEALYDIRMGLRQLIPGAKIVPFGQIVQGWTLMPFWFFFAAMAVLVFRHYRYHRRDAMSVYLMRRLPDRWEYHRRCWAVPLMGAGLGLAAMGILLLLYYMLYILATPAQCLP